MCNQTEPRTHSTKHFKSLLQKKFSQLIQLRTGHAFIGQYYRQFIPTETINCCCGELIETRLHILQECPLYEEWWHLLNNDENQFNLADILGTDDGATKVSSFLEASGAYEKKPRNETEVGQDKYDDPQWYTTTTTTPLLFGRNIDVYEHLSSLKRLFHHEPLRVYLPPPFTVATTPYWLSSCSLSARS